MFFATLVFVASAFAGVADTVSMLYAGAKPGAVRLALVAAFFVFQCAVLLYAFRKHGIQLAVGSVILFLGIDLASRFLLLFSLAALPALFLLAPFYWLMRDGNSIRKAAEELMLTKKNLLWNVGLGIAGSLFIGVVVVALLFLLSLVGIQDQANVARKISALPWYVVLVAITIAPLGEEMFFRGFLAKRAGVLGSSALFAAAHFVYGSIAEVAAAFAIGIVLCYLMRAGRSLAAPLLSHVLFNAASLALMNLF